MFSAVLLTLFGLFMNLQMLTLHFIVGEINITAIITWLVLFLLTSGTIAYRLFPFLEDI